MAHDWMGESRVAHDWMGDSRVAHDWMGDSRVAHDWMGESRMAHDLMSYSRVAHDLMSYSRMARSWLTPYFAFPCRQRNQPRAEDFEAQSGCRTEGAYSHVSGFQPSRHHSTVSCVGCPLL